MCVLKRKRGKEVTSAIKDTTVHFTLLSMPVNEVHNWRASRKAKYKRKVEKTRGETKGQREFQQPLVLGGYWMHGEGRMFLSLAFCSFLSGHNSKCSTRIEYAILFSFLRHLLLLQFKRFLETFLFPLLSQHSTIWQVRGLLCVKNGKENPLVNEETNWVVKSKFTCQKQLVHD